MIARFLSWLLGHRCALGCGERVYPANVAEHYEREHAGDR